MSEAAPTLPLAHITVVALEQAVAAPFATRQLADLGARVIKLERPGTGDFARAYDSSVHGQSSYFAWLNRGKESLTLDLKRPRPLALAQRLVARADVFVQNLAPGAAARLGLDGRTVSGRHPRLVAADLTGYGPDGPWSERKAYDLLIQCETGLVSLTGPDGAGARTGVSIADISGGMYLLTGILAALAERERTGRGRSLSVSLLDSLAEWMGQPIHMTVGSGRPPARTGLAHPTIAPYGPFPTRDTTVIIAVQNEREWHRLCADVLGTPELATDPDFDSNEHRVANRVRLDQRIAAVTATHTAEELRRRLDTAAIANARVNTVPEFLDHPQLRARGRWQDVQTPGGPVRALVPPVAYDNTPAAPMGPVPAVGAHTDQVLTELGLTSEDIGSLRAEGSI
jgi:formyl-CoA transferase